MITDRRRVELAVIPMAFCRIAGMVLDDTVACGMYERPEDHPELWEAAHLLGRAAAMALGDGVGDDKAVKLCRRTQRMVNNIMADRRGILAAYRYAQRLLIELLESERLVLYAGSDFERGYELLESAILSEPDNAAALDEIDRSAAKAARKTLARLEREGVFA